MGKLLIITGVIFVIVGGFIHFYGRIPLLGKLPGDIVIERENFKLYLPIASSILVSLIITLIFYLINRFRG